MRKHIPLIVFLLVISIIGNAQLTVALPDLRVDEEETFIVPISVNNFKQITSGQTAIHWDPTVIQFVEIFSYDLPSINPSQLQFTFGWQDVDQGDFYFIWYHTSGVDRMDGDAIFELRFQAIGNMLDSTGLTFENLPQGQIDWADTSNTTINYVLNDGSVVINDRVSTPAVENDNRSTPIQNLRLNSSQLSFDLLLTRTTTTQITLTDVQGRTLYNQSSKYIAGSHGIIIDLKSWTVPRICYLSVQTPDGVWTQKLGLTD